MRAFLEKCGSEWLDDFVYSSVMPLNDLGVTIIPFDGNDLPKLLSKYTFDKTDILIGSVEATKLFFNECGIKEPQYIGYPDKLEKYLYRDINVVEFKDLKDRDYPYFIKPFSGVKDFTGTTVSNKKQFKILTDYYPIKEDTKLYVSTPIDIQSEYRCFVHKGELKGIQWYAGDFGMFPDLTQICKMIQDYKNAPISYTLDIGIIYKGGSEITSLIEVNDFWAIGSYGLNGKIYVRMIIDRFHEIFKMGI